ncbi:hypothetical protein CPB83DRAFT_844697, partial [Crepidotus variabilis]
MRLIVSTSMGRLPMISQMNIRRLLFAATWVGPQDALAALVSLPGVQLFFLSELPLLSHCFCGASLCINLNLNLLIFVLRLTLRV